LGIVIGCMLLPLPAEMFDLYSKHEWLRPVWGGCWSVVVLITGVLAYIYRHRYKPALYRARSDLQSTMLAQLQQQVADLSRKLEHRS